jgi:hypothetical protein
LKIEENFAKTIFFVEGDSYHAVSMYSKMECYNIQTWIDIDCIIRHVGDIKGDKTLPVKVEFNWKLINGQMICFYNGCSNYVDWNMIEQYIDTNYHRKWNNNTRLARTNLTNFHLCIHAIQERNQKSLRGDNS